MVVEAVVVGVVKWVQGVLVLMKLDEKW